MIRVGRMSRVINGATVATKMGVNVIEINCVVGDLLFTIFFDVSKMNLLLNFLSRDYQHVFGSKFSVFYAK